MTFHHSNAPRWNAAVDAPASSYSNKQRWSVGTINNQRVAQMERSGIWGFFVDDVIVPRVPLRSTLATN